MVSSVSQKAQTAEWGDLKGEIAATWSARAPDAETGESITALVLWWRRLAPKGSSRAHVLTLVSGAALAQAAMVLFAPVLTRLYEPADFAVYALFVALVTLISAVAPGRYEFALMLQDEDRDAVNTLVLALALSAGMSLVVFGVLAVSYFWLARLLNVPLDAGWVWLLPIGILLRSWYNVAAKWQARGDRFTSMACADLGACVASLSIQIGAGIALAFVTGAHLIGGFLLGRGNQQIAPRLIARACRDGLIVLATEPKLAALAQPRLWVDTGDPELDRTLSGFVRVRTGRGREMMMRIAAS